MRDVAAGLEFVELRVDGGLRQLLGGGQVIVGGVVDVQLGCGLGQLLRERGGLLHLLVERHDHTQVVCRRVLQERGLQECQAAAAPGLLGLPDDGGGVADLQDAISKPARISRSIASESPSSAPGSQAPNRPSGSSAMLAISASWPGTVTLPG